MPTINELGLSIGDSVEYYPSINGANFGPSYSNTPREAEIVGFSPSFHITKHTVYEVYLYPANPEDLPHWGIQNLETGEIRFNRELSRYNPNTRRDELVMTIDQTEERFIAVHRANDPDRFVPQTYGQELRDLVRTFTKEITRTWAMIKAAW